MYTDAYWSQQLSNPVAEMSQLSTVCDITMLDPGVLERVLKGDEEIRLMLDEVLSTLVNPAW